MLIAHAPVGYLVGNAIRRWSSVPGLVPAAVAGALAPDLDMLLWLADRSIHHHAWPTHWPIAWLAVAAILTPGLGRPSTRRWATLGLVFAGNALLHLMLDTVAGDIRWLAPFSSQAWSLVHIRRTFEPWWLNFVLHPIFFAELALVVGAARVNRSGPRATGWPGGDDDEGTGVVGDAGRL